MAKDWVNIIFEIIPNHYELLGLKLFETDQEKIKTAALERTKKVKEWDGSLDRDTAKNVGDLRVNVSRAFAELSDETKKLAYDMELAKELGISVTYLEDFPSPSGSKKLENSKTITSSKPPEKLKLRKESVNVEKLCVKCGAPAKNGMDLCVQCAYDLPSEQSVPPVRQSTSTKNSEETGTSAVVKVLLGAGAAVVFSILLTIFLVSRNSAEITRKSIASADNLKTIGKAMFQYSDDYDGSFPDKLGAAGLEQLRSGGYLKDPKVFCCDSPARRRPAESNSPLSNDTVSYIYIGAPIDTNVKSNAPLVWEKFDNFPQSGSVLYVNGKVKSVCGEAWRKKMRELEKIVIANGNLKVLQALKRRSKEEKRELAIKIAEIQKKAEEKKNRELEEAERVRKEDEAINKKKAEKLKITSVEIAQSLGVVKVLMQQKHYNAAFKKLRKLYISNSKERRVRELYCRFILFAKTFAKDSGSFALRNYYPTLLLPKLSNKWRSEIKFRNAHAYVHIPQANTWYSAKAICGKAKGHLVTISDAAENDFVSHSVIKNSEDCWMGAYNSKDLKYWWWCTGEAWDFTDWAPGEPKLTPVVRSVLRKIDVDIKKYSSSIGDSQYQISKTDRYISKYSYRSFYKDRVNKLKREKRKLNEKLIDLKSALQYLKEKKKKLQASAGKTSGAAIFKSGRQRSRWSSRRTKTHWRNVNKRDKYGFVCEWDTPRWIINLNEFPPRYELQLKRGEAAVNELWGGDKENAIVLLKQALPVMALDDRVWNAGKTADQKFISDLLSQAKTFITDSQNSE